MSKVIKGIKQIEEELRKLGVVQDIKIVKPKPVTYDVIHFTIVHSESAAIVMSVELFGSFSTKIKKY